MGSANGPLLVLLVLGAGAFIGVQFLFGYMKGVCDRSAPGHNETTTNGTKTNGTHTGGCASSGTRFDCGIGLCRLVWGLVV